MWLACGAIFIGIAAYFDGIAVIAYTHLVGGSFAPWLLMLFVGLYVAAHVNQGKSDAAYVGMQTGIAIVIAMVQGQGPSPDIASALNRLIGVFGGMIVISLCQPLLAAVVGWVIRPRE